MGKPLPETGKGIVSDHPFEPRLEERGAIGGGKDALEGWVYILLPPNEWLCQQCNLGEAAHEATTVTRD